MFLEKLFKKNEGQKPALPEPFTATLVLKIEYLLQDGRAGDRRITERIESYQPNLFDAQYQKTLTEFSRKLKEILNIVNKANLSPDPYILIAGLIIKKEAFVQAYICRDDAEEKYDSVNDI